MSPYELTNYRTELDAALTKLGWVRKTVEQYHEREWDCSWKEECWYKDNMFLISENNLTLGLVEELIKISKVSGKLSEYRNTGEVKALNFSVEDRKVLTK